ncbi:unnamed protein product [Caenorhabditis angaria]|uniref:Alpha/beta hydrolase fold-3 domain-containing protein n=1 Tax=Caenorhabditis angaria TaxID=860376 RepID=A0A9P1N9G6_9PELO|nr:unnamed protein product [Caenorhabditis angaria]
MQPKTKKSRNIGKIILAFAVVTLCIFLILHKPLPAGFAKSKIDRVTLHVIEPVLRAVYYYPSRMFSKPTDMVWWTRLSLNGLAKVTGPITVFDHFLNIENKDWNGVPVRVFNPVNQTSATGGVVVFIHGGGFALGNVEMYDSLTRRIAKQMNTFVVSIEYRLSPETPFPGGLHDCENALAYLFENGAKEYGLDLNRVVVMGDSAGGNLATAVTQRRVARGQKPAIAGQVLLYPLLQLVDMQTVSYRYFHKRLDGFALVDPESVAYYYMFYAGIDMNEKKYLVPYVLTNGHVKPELKAKIDKKMSYEKVIETYPNYNNITIPKRWPIRESQEAQELLKDLLTNPDFSPMMRENLSGMPKSLVVTCEYDVLRDEGIIYAERLKKAGVPTTAVNYKNGFHAMLNMHNEVIEASNCLNDVISWTLQNIIINHPTHS